MSSNGNYESSQYPFDVSKTRSEVITQTLKGFLIAAVVFGGPAVFIFVIHMIGTLLPPESKEAVDPTPDSFSYIVQYEDDGVA